MPASDVALSLSGVGKAFAGLRALDNVSFDVARGSVQGLIGPNGAGKSTLFNVIAGAIPADSGDISFEGQSLRGAKPYEVARRGVARTFQLTRPFGSLSVRDNVAVAGLSTHRSLSAAREAADDTLSDVALDEWSSRRAADVPAGVLRRLELAKALAVAPRLVLLDEIFAGLSAHEREPIVELIGRLRDRGLTIVLVDHVLEAVMALSDRIVCLDHGQVIADGSPGDVSRNPQVVEAYLGGTP